MYVCFNALHDKLLYVLNQITDFAFKGGTKACDTVYNSGAFWSHPKVKLEDLTLSKK